MEKILESLTICAQNIIKMFAENNFDVEYFDVEQDEIILTVKGPRREGYGSHQSWTIPVNSNRMISFSYLNNFIEKAALTNRLRECLRDMSGMVAYAPDKLYVSFCSC